MNICKVVFYYIGILTVSIVFVKMLYELITKKYKKKLVMDDSRKNTKIQYFQILFRFLYKGIIIKHNKTEPTYTKTSLFLCEKRRFFMARTEKGVVMTI